MLNTYTITIPTVGYETWTVKAASEEEARQLLDEHNRTGKTPSGRLKQDEESYGEWADTEEWEVEEEEG